MKIEKGKFVSLAYELTVDGKIEDKSPEGQPLEFVFGVGVLLPKFEENIEGKVKGDKFAFTLQAEEGYGVHRPEMVAELPKNIFEVNGKIEEGLLEIGNIIPMQTGDGQRLLGRVYQIAGDNVTMDFNHPMAGKVLNFTGEVIDVREATEEDYPSRGSCDCGCEDGKDCNCEECN